MVTKTGTTSYQRKGKRLAARLIPLAIVTVVFVFGFLGTRRILVPAPFRQTVVVVSDPLHVVSFDMKRQHITALDVPLDTVIPAALGYGRYTVRAIVSLDAIDHRDGTLIMSSISNALGLPISGYIQPGQGESGNASSEKLKQLFSPGSIVTRLSRPPETSIAWADWVRLVLAASSVSPDAVDILDIRSAIASSIAPDGSAVRTLDESRIDYLLDTAFFDAGIRSEGISVAVYNTTGIASVGQRASRQLARVGMQLVFVGNAEPEVARCLVSGSESAAETKTAAFIARHFDCDIQKDGNKLEETGADLVVLLGTEFASLYK